MPVFFLHIYNSTGIALGEEGREFPSLEIARSEALVGIRSLLADEVMAGSMDLRGHIDIADEGGAILDTIAFHEAVEFQQDSGLS